MDGPLEAGLPPRPHGALRLRGADAAAARARPPSLPRRAGPPLRAADHQESEIKVCLQINKIIYKWTGINQNN